MPSQIDICLLNSSDLDRVMMIELASYPIPWTRSLFESSFSSADECWAFKVGGEVQGYAIISNILDEAHLLNICIHSDFAGRGLGRKLLKYVIDRAVSRGASMFFLEVRVSNQSAIDLYFSEGFNEVGIRPNYYPSKKGREDALLMTLELSIDQHV